MNDELLVRVRVLEVWEDIEMTLSADSSIGDVKKRALDTAHVPSDPAGYMVKFRGAELRDERRSLADECVPQDGALIVLRRRRVPVR